MGCGTMGFWEITFLCLVLVALVGIAIAYMIWANLIFSAKEKLDDISRTMRRLDEKMDRAPDERTKADHRTGTAQPRHTATHDD
jgi:uncharacterized membrane protein YciS (DUF1049 family)